MSLFKSKLRCNQTGVGLTISHDFIHIKGHRVIEKRQQGHHHVKAEAEVEAMASTNQGQAGPTRNSEQGRSLPRARVSISKILFHKEHSLPTPGSQASSLGTERPCIAVTQVVQFVGICHSSPRKLIVTSYSPPASGALIDKYDLPRPWVELSWQELF